MKKKRNAQGARATSVDRCWLTDYPLRARSLPYNKRKVHSVQFSTLKYIIFVYRITLQYILHQQNRREVHTHTHLDVIPYYP